MIKLNITSSMSKEDKIKSIWDTLTGIINLENKVNITNMTICVYGAWEQGYNLAMGGHETSIGEYEFGGYIAKVDSYYHTIISLSKRII